MFVDAHVHLSESKARKQLFTLQEEWEKVGVVSVLNVSTTLHESKIALQQSNPPSIYSAIGKHPWKCKRPLTEEERLSFSELSRKTAIHAIGEVGLDHHFVKQAERYPFQLETFQFFIQLAIETHKPLNLHVKGAEPLILPLLKEFDVDPAKVNIHWYSGPLDLAAKLIDFGAFFSVNPSFLSRSGPHFELARMVPLDQLLTESDGLMKLTRLGLFSEPKLIPTLLQELAAVKGLDLSLLKEVIFRNFHTFLGT